MITNILLFLVLMVVVIMLVNDLSRKDKYLQHRKTKAIRKSKPISHTKATPEYIKHILVMYFISSCLFFIGGLATSIKINNCGSFDRRIEYVFPAYKLGCFLGEPIDKHK